MDKKNEKSQISWYIYLLLLILLFIVVAIIVFLCKWFSSLDSGLAAGLVTAFTTIFVATLTLVVGRYFERIKEAESHLRERKIAIYDEFLKEFFKLFNKENKLNNRAEGSMNQTTDELVSFLWEWQRKLIVWGGPDVLLSYIKWKDYMTNHSTSAQNIFLMENFFKMMRKDIGLSNKGLVKGTFSHLILRYASNFLKQAQLNPEISLAEIASSEKKMNFDNS